MKDVGNNSPISNVHIVGFYLPPKHSTTLTFLQQILNGQKQVFLKKVVIPRTFPQYKEFTMTELWRNIDGDASVLSYLPDRDSQSRPVCRTFAFTVLSTLRPGYSKEIVEHAIDQRTDKIATKPAPEMVTISDGMLRLFTRFPMQPSKYNYSFEFKFRKEGKIHQSGHGGTNRKKGTEEIG